MPATAVEPLRTWGEQHADQLQAEADTLRERLKEALRENEQLKRQIEALGLPA